MNPSALTIFRRFTPFAWLVVGLIFCQMVLGATVRATGSGMGCPDWPLCHGSYLPAPNFESILEYSHRFVAALVTLTVFTLGLWVIWNDALRAHLGRLGFAFGLLIACLITFGAVTVAYDMPPAVVACHLELAALFLCTWLTIARRSHSIASGHTPQMPNPGAYRWMAVATLAGAFVQLFLGAMVSVSHAGLACPDFPTCYGMALPPLVGNVKIQMLHRFGAYTVALLVYALVFAAEFQAAQNVRRWTRLAAGLVIVQIALGASVVLLKIPAWLSVAHLANGMLLFVTLFLTVYEVFPRFWSRFADGIETAELTKPPTLSLQETLGAYYQLTKPGIVLLVVLTGLPAVLIAGRGDFSVVVLLAALAGTSLAAASAAVFNQFFERERDKVMERTAARPIPSGKVSPRAALIYAVLLGIASMVILIAFTTTAAAWIAFASLVFYGFFYTLVLKDASPQNIVVGGVAGATAPLIGWAAVTGSVGLPAWIMFLIIFLWTPPHFWALAIYRLDDYEAAKIPMFPVVYGVPATARWIVVYTMMLVPLTLLLVPIGAAGPIYYFSAIILGLGFLLLSGLVLLRQRKKDAIALFAYSIAYTLVLFAALTVDAMAAYLHLLPVLAAR